MGVAEPGRDRHGVLRMEHVGGGGVVDDDQVFERTAHLRQVLDVVAVVVVARLSEQSVVDHLVHIEDVQQGVTVAGHGRGEDDYLEELATASQKLVHPGSLDHVHVVDLVFDLHGDDKVGVAHVLERGMHQGLVQVQDKTLLTAQLGRDRVEKPARLGHGLLGQNLRQVQRVGGVCLQRHVVYEVLLDVGVLLGAVRGLAVVARLLLRVRVRLHGRVGLLGRLLLASGALDWDGARGHPGRGCGLVRQGLLQIGLGGRESLSAAGGFGVRGVRVAETAEERRKHSRRSQMPINIH